PPSIEETRGKRILCSDPADVTVEQYEDCRGKGKCDTPNLTSTGEGACAWNKYTMAGTSGAKKKEEIERLGNMPLDCVTEGMAKADCQCDGESKGKAKEPLNPADQKGLRCTEQTGVTP